MQVKAGIFLRSTAALDDTVFAGVTIFVAEANAGGAVGFVINQPFGRSLHELEEFRHCPEFALYDGGPVDKEHLFFLHRRPDRINEGTLVSSNVWWGGNFQQVISGIKNRSLSANDVKIFVGYCGWDACELEAEIAEGSWMVVQELDERVFATSAH